MTTQPLTPLALRCAHRRSPIGVEPERVRFAWRLEGGTGAARQAAYQIEVSAEDAAADAAPLWDSGRVESSSSSDVAYLGPALEPAGRYRWRVRVFGEGDDPGPWSAPERFEVALGGTDRWRACWIGLGPDVGPHAVPTGEGLGDRVLDAMRPAPYLRRAFSLEEGREIAHARLHVTARGVYEVTLNGAPAGDAVLAPGWTDYEKRCLYQSYDVTALLSGGENVLAAIVADGWACSFYGFDPKRRGAHYAPAPLFAAQLVVTYGDGGELWLGTDSSWRSSTGSVIHADLLMGERREDALEPAGWRRAGFDDSSWRPVTCEPLGDVALVADPGVPIRAVAVLPAVSLSRQAPDVVIADFGQNLVGWVELEVDVPAGTEVRVRHGEVLDEHGGLYVENLRTARAIDSYVATGERATFAPRFTFHGFRYAEIRGLVDLPRPEQVRAVVVHSDTPETGTFSCSSESVNQLWRNIDWGQRGNFLSVPTDCPQRDERLGWLGDAQIFVRTAAYNRDVSAFFSKWMDDVTDAQLPSGAYPDFAPRLGFNWASSPAWGNAGVIVPWTLYKMYGDRSILERQFASMRRWMDHLASHNPNRRWRNQLGNNYGDWLAPHGDDTPRELLATAYWAQDARMMAEISSILGNREEAEDYAQLVDEIRSAFQTDYLDNDGAVASGTQTAYALALHMGLVPDELQAPCAARLAQAVVDAGWRLTTGFVGVGYLLPVLSEHGYSEVAYRLLEQREYPSWLYSVDRGATTIWERWDGWTEERGFQSPRMNSFNHYSLGSVGEWLYRYVLGIEQAPGSAGFATVTLRPHPGGTLDSARGAFSSVRGTIATAWSRHDGELHVEVTVPPNVEATVHLASSRPEQAVAGNGSGPREIAPFPGALGAEEAVFAVEPGTHTFSAPVLEPTTAL